MRFLGLIVVVILCFSAPVRLGAQGIETTLRAGEHRDFTRLAMALPDGTDWRLEDGTGHVDLIFINSSPRVDLSQTFARIPRTRLRAVEPLENGIRLFLNCPCSVEPVSGIIGQAVLDIRSSTEAPAISSPSIRPKARPDSAAINSVAQNAGERLARILRGLEDGRPADPFALGYKVAPVPTRLSPNMPQDATSPMVATDVTQSLLAAISGAVSNDLLSANSQFTRPPDDPQMPLSEAAARHVLTQRSRGAAPEELPEHTCTNAISDFMNAWPAELVVLSESGDWSDLYDPLDRVDSVAAARLLQIFLGNGLGTEARSVLSIIPQTRHTVPIRNLSYLLDLEPPPAPDELLKYAGCSDLDALWAFLSNPAQSLAFPNMENRIVRAAQALSPHLRAHLGPSIVNRLLRHGAPNGAGLVQSVLDRSHQTSHTRGTTPGLLLAEPESLTTLGRQDLLDLSDEDLMLVLENAQTRALTLPADFLSLAIDRQFALRRSALGRSFAQLTARALATAGEFDAAFRMANDTETGLEDKERETLRSALFDAVLHTAPDTIFVTTVFAQEPWSNASLSQETRTGLGLRLQELGFPDAALLMQLPAPERHANATPALVHEINRPAGPSRPHPELDRENATDRGTNDRTRPQYLAVAAADPSITAPANTTAVVQSSAPPDIGPRVATQAESPPDVQDAALGLLAKGRRSLEDSEALRARLEALIGDSSATQGLTQ